MNTLREVPINEAIKHTLWEAHACIGQWAFCACLAMLRKALDLWSGEYRDLYRMTFDKAKGEKDVLYWRLKKIADDNKLYRDSISHIIDGLRISANEAVHDSTVCEGGRVGTFDGIAIESIRQPYLQIFQLVVDLITTTLEDIRVVYSDSSQWREKPRS